MDNDSSPSPTASTASGTTTNPNTPRPNQCETDNSRPSQDEPAANEEATASSPSSSDAVDQPVYAIQPTWPRRIDRAKIPARACWQLDRFLEHMFLDIHWAPRGSTGSAFFKLHTGLLLEGAPTTRRDGRVSAYIFIYPERIRQLSFNAQPHNTPLGPDSIGFAFELNRPPVLVLPKSYDGFGPGAEGILESLRALARQSTFTVLAHLPSRTLPAGWLQQLCTAVTGQKLSTIAARANLASLYQGQGAQLLEGDNLPETDSHGNDDEAALNPPAYEDTGPSPPLVSPSKKRRRRSSSNEAEASSQPISFTAMKALLEGVLEARLTTHKHDIAELLCAHESRVEGMLAAHKAGLAEMLGHLEDRVRNNVEDGLTDVINKRISEEMGDVCDSVMDQITSTPLQANLTFPEHPLY